MSHANPFYLPFYKCKSQVIQVRCYSEAALTAASFSACSADLIHWLNWRSVCSYYIFSPALWCGRSCFDPVPTTSTSVLLHLIVNLTTSAKCYQVRVSHLHWCRSVGQTLSVPLLCRNSTAVKKTQPLRKTEQLCVNSISGVGIVSIIIIVLAFGLFSQKRAGVSFLERLAAVSGYCGIFWLVYRQEGTTAAFISPCQARGVDQKIFCVRQSSKQLIVRWTAQAHVTG